MINVKLMNSPGAAWLATAREMKTLLERLVGYVGRDVPYCECAYCAARALLARPEVKEMGE